MTTEIKTLQDLINARADKKLDEMLREARRGIDKIDGQTPGYSGAKPSDLFTENEIADGRCVSVSTIVSKLLRVMEAALLEKNREREAQAFLAEFETLKAQMDEVSSAVQR